MSYNLELYKFNVSSNIEYKVYVKKTDIKSINVVVVNIKNITK
jgi:hypothetical protein